MNIKNILKELVEFNTVKDQENTEIMNYIESLLINKGFKVDYRSKCLIMSIKDKKSLGFLGHTDTVKAGKDWNINPFQMREIDGKLFGLGICDMKGGIAAILQAVLEVDWKKLKKGIKLYFTYDEEINFSGIKEIIKIEKEFPIYMIIGEPTNNIIMNGSKGLLELKLTFKGISAHSSMPNLGENAIEKCLKFINELNIFYQKLKNERNNAFEIPYTTMNIGKITGGKSINIVPSSCEVLIDFRIIDNKHITLILNKIEELSKKYKGRYQIINKIKPFANKNEKINSTNYITEASLENLVEQYKNMIYKFCN